MQIPYFFSTELATRGSLQELSEETSRHIVSVMRMKPGELIHLTNGKGYLITAAIEQDHKKHCVVSIRETSFQPPPVQQHTIALSLLKNASRFEWFLEKATEIGIAKIVPLLCTRTERQHFRKDRMEGVLVSALLQSRQQWMPELQEPCPFNQYIQQLSTENGRHFIAHCAEGERVTLKQQLGNERVRSIAIGPEGDFSTEEIQGALDRGCIPVSLGNTRLRSETAALVAAVWLQQG